ncbi:uncharacterized protein LOC111262042 isoform X2 [Varroa jacobsoni]|uniref:uncharacterized protein LOC111262042 isoform X2 n=1 Tax=Varroa jacobsoni TaxID=62625 RepID=UPI000BF36E5B|nr:uncharacterized protein LOC111262042 isoform X2 [Varroa jacobsoni]
MLPFLVAIAAALHVAESCGFPGSPAHAKVYTSDEHFREGASVTFECDPGYRMLGRSSLRCSNSEWDSPGLPYCVAFRKPTGMSSRDETAKLAVDGEHSTCAETAFGSLHRWWVDLLEEYVVVNVVEVRFGMKLKNATVSISVVDHRINSSWPCTRWTGIDLDDIGARYFSCGSNGNSTTKEGPTVRRANDIYTSNRIANEEDKLGWSGTVRGRYVQVSVEAFHGFFLQLCEISVFSQDLLSPEDVCGESGDKIESFESMCYEATPHKMSYGEAAEYCLKRGGNFWPVSQRNSIIDDETEDGQDAILDDQRVDPKDEEKFVSWMMDVHNLDRVWAAPRKTSEASTTMTPASAVPNATLRSAKLNLSRAYATEKNNINLLNKKDQNATPVFLSSTPLDLDEFSRSLWGEKLVLSSKTNRICGVFIPSRGMRQTTQSSEDTPCSEAVFGICVRSTQSCGRPALPKRLTSWKDVGKMAQGEVFSKFECEQGYYVSGPGSVHCKKHAGLRQETATQCRSSMCGAPPLVANSFVVLDTTRPYLRCVNDSFILHGRAQLYCDPVTARWDHPRATCIHLPTGVRYHDKSLAYRLAQGIELFPRTVRAGVIILLVTLLFLKILVSVALVNLFHYCRVVRPSLARKADSSTMLTKMHEELHGDVENGALGTLTVVGSSLQAPKPGATDELELSNEDVRVVTHASESEERHNKSQKKFSTPKAPDTPKLRLSESPIEDLMCDSTIHSSI